MAVTLTAVSLFPFPQTPNLFVVFSMWSLAWPLREQYPSEPSPELEEDLEEDLPVMVEHVDASDTKASDDDKGSELHPHAIIL